jgi:hypothetical protein
MPRLHAEVIISVVDKRGKFIKDLYKNLELNIKYNTIRIRPAV